VTKGTTIAIAAIRGLGCPPERELQVTVIGCGRLGATHAASTASIGHEAPGLGIGDGNVGGVPVDGGRPDE
jgi:hypothetical protein